jgi:ferredoxin-thioredoxin reductase catalytic subunit
MIIPAVTEEELQKAYRRLQNDARAAGYYLHPDAFFAEELIKGLLVNEKRYGYGACPCRLASGNAAEDRDIQCPCDYRDADLDEFGQCYCGLYVSEEVSCRPEKCVGCIPERRGSPMSFRLPHRVPDKITGLSYPVWRCPVCGYLCAREEAPHVCPICKARKDRFERFM